MSDPLLTFVCMTHPDVGVRLRALANRWFVLAVALLCLAGAPLLHGADVNSLAKPTGYLSDFASIVNESAKTDLEAYCTRVEQKLGVQLALVTVDTVGDRDIRDFALDLSRKWGVGSKQSNQGVLLLLAIKDHKSDIETGRGIEPYLTDGFSGGTLRAMRPDLRAGDYGAALTQAAHTMAAQIAQGKGIAFDSEPLPQPEIRRETRTRSRGTGIPGPLIFLGILFVLWILSRGGRRGGGGGGGGSFLTGMLLGNLLGGGRGRGGNGWGDGGGFGGGSGGGGGFGGFGGGDFGGGGASSDW